MFTYKSKFQACYKIFTRKLVQASGAAGSADWKPADSGTSAAAAGGANSTAASNENDEL